MVVEEYSDPKRKQNDVEMDFTQKHSILRLIFGNKLFIGFRLDLNK